MKAVVFSGTTEGRQFSKILANLGVEVLVSVATEIGAEEQDENENITIHVGRCTAAEMTKLLHGASICVDATHPYATEATRTICEACETTGVEYHRLLRTESELPKNSIVFETAAEAAE
ncbi:precorrin-6A/cobalt-precorrin-6A reductase, partial [Hominenteromicrobium sp.]